MAASATRGRPAPATIALVLAALLAAAALAYALLFRPGDDSAAAPQANAAAGEVGSVETMIAGLTERLRQDPDNHEGWFLLGMALRNSERFAEAGRAFRRAMELAPQNADYTAYLGEMLILAADTPPPEAERLFRRALALQPANAQARYYLATMKDLNGDHRGALDDLIALLSEAPPGAPWEPQVRGAATAIARANDIDISGRLPGAPAPASSPATAAIPGPTPEQMAAASSIPPSRQDAMGRDMVERLAARLRQSPRDADGWIRLMRSRMVLRDPRAAGEALRSGLAAYQDDAATQTRLRQAARELGVPAGVMDWSPDSWRHFDARQQPDYPDRAALAAATRELRAYPPLVRPAATDALRAALAEAQAGRAFLVQGGDCAESFAEFSPDNIAGNFRLIEAMAETLSEASGLPVVRIGRMAGQFAKPRSAALEVQGGTALPAYRGDIVNGIGFTPADRRPNPERMFRAYAQAAATLSHLERLAAGTPFWTSHEALLLPFEQALVRREDDRAYASSAHFLWIGQRTTFEGSAHVEFVRGLANPVGIKCGPDLAPDSLLRLLDTIDPDHEPGRITLIARMGASRIAAALPPLIDAVKASGRPVLWACDPMHANTLRTAAGTKTRPLELIFAEFGGFFAAAGDCAGGVHLEMTGRNVTECTGGETRLTEADLAESYHSHCDPRLNPAQAMELAERVARALAGRIPVLA